MADWNDPQTWIDWTGRNQGRRGVERFGEQISYLDGRLFADTLDWYGTRDLQHYKRKIQQVQNAPNFTPASDILIVGCGLGWGVEVGVDLGSNNIWGVDTSTLIQTLWDDPQMGIRSDIRALLLPIDISDPQAKQDFKAAGAGNNKGEFNWIITEHVLEDFPLADIPAFLQDAEFMRSNQPGGIIHLITATDNWIGEMAATSLIPNQFTLAEWKAFAPSHYWIDNQTGEML